MCEWYHPGKAMNYRWKKQSNTWICYNGICSLQLNNQKHTGDLIELIVEVKIPVTIWQVYYILPNQDYWHQFFAYKPSQLGISCPILMEIWEYERRYKTEKWKFWKFTVSICIWPNTLSQKGQLSSFIGLWGHNFKQKYWNKNENIKNCKKWLLKDLKTY